MLTWVARFDHWWIPSDSEETAAQIAEILCRPCFRDCTRVNWGRRERWSGYEKKTPALIRDYIFDKQNDLVRLDSGRKGELNAGVNIDTGVIRIGGIAPTSRVAVPCPSDTADLEKAACDLALALRTALGAVTVWPNYNWAEKFAYGSSLTPEQAREMGLSELRHKEWRLQGRDQVQVDTEISGPEWGLFLGPGHLQKLPIAALRASGAFAEVRELGDNRAFLRLTDDPRDALAPDFEARLDRARVALAPILADLSRLD